jgi:hypothetical protein
MRYAHVRLQNLGLLSGNKSPITAKKLQFCYTLAVAGIWLLRIESSKHVIIKTFKQ